MADYSGAHEGTGFEKGRVAKGEKGDKGEPGATGPMGPPGPPGPAAPAPGISVSGGSASSGVLHIPPSMASGGFIPGHLASSTHPPARKPLEHVVLPQRLPRRVLVAFLDDEGNPEPFWAAYLAPQDIQVSMSPLDPQDACMDLRLSLVKVFEQ